MTQIQFLQLCSKGRSWISTKCGGTTAIFLKQFVQLRSDIRLLVVTYLK